MVHKRSPQSYLRRKARFEYMLAVRNATLDHEKKELATHVNLDLIKEGEVLANPRFTHPIKQELDAIDAQTEEYKAKQERRKK